MEWKTGAALCGFVVTRVRENKKIGGALVEMVHEKTGAQLCWVQNGAENKLFSVAFKTIPEDDTGVFHILEHSVLCGSKRYPVREPFLELLKSSMNTFLNAMTYPDKTVYPVSSRNTQDFLNLTGVYLDAVFAPLLLENENIFLQEGWRFEPTGEGMTLNGVVLNEMKGAMSNVDDRMEQGLLRLLFSDNCYRFNSGGEPAAIPKLTYAQFKETYRRFYHPSNARFFLDGDLPMEETLALIDGYLSKFDAAQVCADIPPQAPHKAEQTAYYAVEDETPNRDHLAFAKLIGRFDETDRILAARLLCNLLASTNESPLKRALLSNGLCEDVDLYVSDEVFQPYLVFAVRNTDKAKKDAVLETVRTVIRDLVKNGIEKALLTAYLNKLEFSTRQLPEPQALVRTTSALSYWLYGGDPLEPLDVDENFRRLRAMIETDGYERLLETLFSFDDDTVTLQMLPSLTLTQEEAQAQQAQVDRMLAALTPAQRDALPAKNEALQLWQQTEDSPQAIATIPTLSLSQVSPTARLIETQVETQNAVPVLFHPSNTNGIVYLNLYFPLSGFSLEELELLSAVPAFFTDLPTSEHDAAQLQREVKTYIGRLRFDLTAFETLNDPEHCMPYLTVSAGFLKENLERAMALIAEILTQTRFDDSEKIQEILRQIDEGNRQAAISSGHTLAIGVVRSAFTACGAVKEAIGGFSSMRRIHALLQGFDGQKGEFLALIERLLRAVGTASMTASVTASEPVSITSLLALLPKGETAAPKDCFRLSYPKKVGIRIPAPIAFAVKGDHPCRTGRTADGALWVLSNIASFSYLWNRVRVQGGAYGAGLSGAGRSGIFCYSYRDPNPKNSLAAFDGTADWLKTFLDGNEPLDKYIISSVAASDPLLSPYSAGLTADEWYFSGITPDWLQQRRQEMLKTDHAALRAWQKTLSVMADDGNLCVVGGEELLRTCDGLTVYDLEGNC